jgi:catechol 2,3-dioxygenase-like lactoylglutathione lyase family enzyme
MPVSIDHVAIPSRDPESAAQFLADLLGLEVTPEGPDGELRSVPLDGKATLLFASAPMPVPAQHVALRVGADDFDDVVLRLRARNIPFGNDPEDVTNARWEDPLGGRGRVYFVHPDGHLFEVCC